MGKRTRYEPGTFSWVDLATTDTDGAKAFYGRVFGWRAVDAPAGEGNVYTVFRLDGDAVAGLYRIDPDQQAAGVPPAWLSYVTVDDVDKTAARATELGGSVVTEPFDVLDSGRMAVARDPQGAVVGLWQPRANIGAERVNDPGCLCWNDVVSPDPEASERFYRELFGWDIEALEGAGGYRVIRNGGTTNGGVMPAAFVGSPPPHVLPYFNAGVLDDTVARIEAGGGTTVVAPLALPSGRIAVARDPQGAYFALFEGDADD